MRLKLKIGEKIWTLTEDRSQRVKEALEKGLKQTLTDEETQRYLADNHVELVESNEGMMLYAMIHSSKVLVGQYVPEIPEPEPYHQRPIDDLHKCGSKGLDDARLVKINGKWLLQTSDDLEYDPLYVHDEIEINFCPFCGEKLK